MTWGIVFLLVGLAIVAYSYLSSQDSTSVAKQHEIPVPEGDLTAIEYFWRPG